MGFIDNLLQIVPPFAVVGVLFSWLIWAYFVNNKKFKMKHPVQDTITVLRIFVALIVGIASYFLIFSLFLLTISKSDYTQAVRILTNFSNQILMTFLFLALLVILFLTKTKTTSDEDKKDKTVFRFMWILVYYLVFLVFFFMLGFITGAIFSSYYFLIKTLLGLTVLIIVCSVIFGSLGARIFDSSLMKELRLIEFEKRYKRRLIFLTIFLPLLIFLATFWFSYWSLPQTTFEESVNQFIIQHPSEIYVQKEVVNEIADIGQNFKLSNWIPIYYGSFDLLSEKPIYMNYPKTKLIIAYVDNSTASLELPEKFPEGEFIFNDVTTKSLFLKTTSDVFRNKTVVNISVVGYQRIQTSDAEIILDKSQQVKDKTVIFTYNLSNNLTLKSQFQEFSLGGLTNINTNCTPQKLFFKVTFNNGTLYSDNVDCRSLSCDFSDKRKSPIEGIIYVEGSGENRRVVLRTDDFTLNKNIYLMLTFNC